MRVGFFYGVDGDAEALEAVLALLADCDRVVSLGDLVGPPGASDDACLQALAEGRVVALAGAAEQARARDRRLPEELRARLRGLLPATVEEGAAILSGLTAGSSARRTVDGHPRLVAPLTVAGHRGTARLWRGSGGLARVEEVAAPLSLKLGPERLRLDLGPAMREGGRPCVAVYDREAGTLVLRDGRPLVAAAPRRQPRPIRRRRAPRVAEGQQLLAV